MIESPRTVEHLGGEVFAAAGKASPPVAFVATSAAGLSLDQWVAVATLVYVVLQTALLIWKFFRDRAKERAGAQADG